MCVACLEFIKDKLTVNEFRSALREMTVDDPNHLSRVNQILSSQKSTEDQKKDLQKLNQGD